MFESIDHLIVAVSDLSVATQNYRQLLGRDPSWRGEHPGLGTANTLFRLGNGYLELLAPEGEGAFAEELRTHLSTAGEGLFGLVLGCTDAEACSRELRARGLTASDPTEGAGVDLASGAQRSWRNVYLPSEETRGIMIFAIEHLSPQEALLPARALGEEAATAHEFDHVVVMTKNPDEARALYGERFGIRLALDKTFEKFGSRLIFFRLGGVSIEIGASLKDEPDPEASDDLWGLAYRVADIRAMQSRLQEAGFDVSEVRTGRKPGTRVCTVRNPTHGVATLLIGTVEE